MTDPREQPLNDVARAIMVRANYDPHYSGIEERLTMETKLFLARYDAMRLHDMTADQRMRNTTASPEQIESWKKVVEETRERITLIPGEHIPIPMILFCPNCGLQHVDREEPHKSHCAISIHNTIGDGAGVHCTCDRWTNPSHMIHLCAKCKHVWRPADVPTTGVVEIATRGGRDSGAAPIRGNAMVQPAKDKPQWRHKRGSTYIEIARGELQCSNFAALSEGARLVAYRHDDDGTVWFRAEVEFEDGRFERIG